MNDDELKKIWKSSPDEKIRLEKSQLIGEVQLETDRWTNLLKSNNKFLLIIILIAWIPIFGMMIYSTPFMLSKIGILIASLAFIAWIIHKRRKKKSKPRSFSETYLEYLHKIREYYTSEKKSQSKAIYRFFLPITTGVLLWHIGSFKTVQELIIEISITIVLVAIGYFYHKKVYGNLILKRLVKVERLIEVMEK